MYNLWQMNDIYYHIVQQCDPNAEVMHWLEVIHLKNTYSQPFVVPADLLPGYVCKTECFMYHSLNYYKIYFRPSPSLPSAKVSIIDLMCHNLSSLVIAGQCYRYCMWCYDGIFKTTKFSSETFYPSRIGERWEILANIEWISKGISYRFHSIATSCPQVYC